MSEEKFQHTEYVKTEPTIEALLLCAKIAHAVNSQLCLAVNEPIFGFDAVKDSTIAGIRAILSNPNMTAEQSHESWLEYKTKEGWKLGAVKDLQKKTSPAMMPYEMLPPATKFKDAMFQAVVRSFFDVWPDAVDPAPPQSAGPSEPNNMDRVLRAMEQHVRDEVERLFSGPTTVKLTPRAYTSSQDISVEPLALARDACGLLQRAEKAGAAIFGVTSEDWVRFHVIGNKLICDMSFIVLGSDNKEIQSS